MVANVDVLCMSMHLRPDGHCSQNPEVMCVPGAGPDSKTAGRTGERCGPPSFHFLPLPHHALEQLRFEQVIEVIVRRREVDAEPAGVRTDVGAREGRLLRIRSAHLPIDHRRV